jgi:hypothetical protein
MYEAIMLLLSEWVFLDGSLDGPWDYVKLVYWLYVYYCAVMALKRAISEKRAPLPMKIVGYLFILPPALFLDWLVNMLLSFPMLDPPGEWVGFGRYKFFPKELVTGRLKRYKHDPTQPRARREFATFIALLLDAVDPEGPHV